jgi:hypothetical protein
MPAAGLTRPETRIAPHAFHTTIPEHGAGHRDVYHDNNGCSDGKRIKPEHRVPGTGGRRRCDECASLT